MLQPHIITRTGWSALCVFTIPNILPASQLSGPINSFHSSVIISVHFSNYIIYRYNIYISHNIQHKQFNILQAVERRLEKHHFSDACCSTRSRADELFLKQNALVFSNRSFFRYIYVLKPIIQTRCTLIYNYFFVITM